MVVGLWAVRKPEHRHLAAWVPTTWLYFPLGCLAAWKAIYEVVAHPFYWDKTLHGIHDQQAESSAAEAGAGSTVVGHARPAALRPARAAAPVPSALRTPSATEPGPRTKVEVIGAIS